MKKYVVFGMPFLLVGFILGFSAGVAIGISTGEATIQNRAIKAGVARRCYIDPPNVELRRHIIVWGTECKLNEM